MRAASEPTLELTGSGRAGNSHDSGRCDFPIFAPQSPIVKSRSRPPKAAKRRRPPSESASAPAAMPPSELTGLLDSVKATVIALLASLQEKERGLRQQLGAAATPGVKTGLSDIRLLRRWADRTLQTIGVLERGQQDGDLRTLLAELDEFSEIVHAHDAEMAEESLREIH
jgi:hypothetical protein